MTGEDFWVSSALLLLWLEQCTDGSNDDDGCDDDKEWCIFMQIIG